MNYPLWISSFKPLNIISYILSPVRPARRSQDFFDFALSSRFLIFSSTLVATIFSINSNGIGLSRGNWTDPLPCL